MSEKQTRRKFRTPLGIDLSRLKSGEHPQFSHSSSSPPASLEVLERELAKVLNTKLGTAVALPTFGDSATSFGELVAEYKTAWAKLETCKSEWINFLSCVPLFDVTVDGRDLYGTVDQMSKSAQQKWKQELINGLVWPSDAALSGVKASLSLLPLSDSRAELSVDLAGKLNSIAMQMVTHLSLLVERKVCGLVEWYSPNACKYQFYVRQIVSSEMPELQTRTNVYSQNLNSMAGRTQFSGKHEKTISWHIHELINAIEVHPGNTSMTIPANRLTIIHSIPGWLNGTVRIVEGTLIREIKIIEDCESDTWTDFVESPTLFHDPAIVLGAFVLSGWKESTEPMIDPKSVPQKENPSRGGLLQSLFQTLGFKP